MQLKPSFGTVQPRKIMALLCLAMLLVATSLQVMHHCTGLEIGGAPQAENEGAAGSSPVFCSVCMTVHVAALVVLLVVLAVARVRSFAPSLPTLFPPETVLPFSLYVRPPPACSC